MEFSKKLYKLRKEKGLSQEELANKLNVSRQTISKWEVGETTPELEKLVDLSNVFSISLDELVLDKEESEKTKETNDGETSFQKNLRYIKAKLYSEDSKKVIKTILKYALIVLGVMISIELIVMIIYVIKNGFPSL